MMNRTPGAGYSYGATNKQQAEELAGLQDLFFGRTALMSGPAAGQHVVNHTLPDAYKNQSLTKVSSLIVVMIMTSARKLLDWLPLTSNQHSNAFAMYRVTFDLHNLDYIPEQGTGRVMTQTHESWTCTLERRGIGFQMEDGFFMTPQGQRDYWCHISQIANSTITAVCTDILNALLYQAAAIHDMVTYTGQTYTDQEFDTKLQQEYRYTGICVKSDRCALELQERADTIAMHRNLEGNFPACITAVGHNLFFKLDQANQDPALRGSKAEAFRSGAANSFASDIHMKQYSSFFAPVGAAGGNWSDLLLRPCVYGEATETRITFDVQESENYTSASNHVVLHNHRGRNDRPEKVQLKQLLDNAPLFEDASENAPLTDEAKAFLKKTGHKHKHVGNDGDPKTRLETIPVDEREPGPTLGDFLAFHGLEEGFDQAFERERTSAKAKAAWTNPKDTPLDQLTRKHFQWFIDHDIPFPLRFVCVRFLNDIMASMIVGFPGKDTGQTHIGDANFQLSHIGK
jgi:hypothetical protein